jgi:hypothetical protein
MVNFIISLNHYYLSEHLRGVDRICGLRKVI